MKYLVFFSGLLLLACGSNNGPKNIVVEEVVVDSVKWFNEQVKNSPLNLTLLFERALFFKRNGDIDRAQADLEKYLNMDSSNLNVHKEYADIMLSRLILEKSKYHYDYIIERDSLNSGAFLGMGKLYALLENNAAAITYLNRSLQLDPYQSEPYFMKGMIYRSDFEQTGRTESWDWALSSFQTAIEQDPDNYSAYVQLGVMYDQQGDSAALDYYDAALNIFPESSEAWYNKGMYYQNRGEVEPALECYRTLNRIDSLWADPYHNEGYIHLLMTENLDSAIYFFDKAVNLDPNYYQAYNNLALAYEKKGDVQNARFYYTRAVEINPEFKLAKDNLNRLR